MILEAWHLSNPDTQILCSFFMLIPAEKQTNTENDKSLNTEGKL